MKKLIGVIITFFILFQTIVFAAPFNSQNVFNLIRELSNEKYRGRLSGDIGNELACDFVAEKFKRANLTPIGDNKTYFQSFFAYVPFINGKASFKVFDNNKLIKEYIYGTDYKEVIYGLSVGGEVKGKIYSDESKKGNIFIDIDRPFESNSTYDFDKELLSKGIKAIIYISDNRMDFKSTYKFQNEYKDGLVKVILDNKYFDEIIKFQRKGYTFEIKSPLEFKKVKTKNVVAMKRALKKEGYPLIFTAHIDHVGFDAINRIYPGALDNASGVAFLIELASFLKDKYTNRDIIFVAFNAEEEGLLGSYYFVNHPPITLENAECINFDMIGTKKDIPLTALKSIYSLNRNDSIDAFLNLHRLARSYEDSSDHVPFSLKNISAVTLIHDDIDKIHTPYDTIGNISVDKITEAFLIVEDFLKTRNIFIEKSEIIYNRYVVYIVTSIFLILFVLIFSNTYKKQKSIS
ncbi:MAG: M28 family metallopeptidase [Caloramator sp.]|nr:M28 family metallopeptidase [Caloramator sp.]